jgi:hypothetical protein
LREFHRIGRFLKRKRSRDRSIEPMGRGRF